LHAIEIEDIHHRTAFLDGDSVVNLPLFRLQGISLLSVFILLLLFITVHSAASALMTKLLSFWIMLKFGATVDGDETIELKAEESN